MMTLLITLFFVALIAGFIDAIAGGGGLLTVPALLSAGLPPADALATNKLQSVGGSFSATLYFVRQKAVDLAEQKIAIIFTFIGAIVGAVIVQFLEADFLRRLLPILVIAVGLYFLFTPQLGSWDSQRRLSSTAFGVIIGLSIGFYDGFFGPGTGSFFCVAYVVLAGYNLAKATAHAKVLNFTSNLASLLFFILGNKVIWSIGLVMLAGQFIGARVGAKMVLTKGQKLIRPMLIVLSFIMSIKLIYDNHGNELYYWFSQLTNSVIS